MKTIVNDQYQFQEEFIDNGRYEINDLGINETLRSENIPNEERIVNEDGLITNDSDTNKLDTDYAPHDSELEDEIENERDLDDDEELDDFEAEHYPEYHPRA